MTELPIACLQDLIRPASVNKTDRICGLSAKSPRLEHLPAGGLTAIYRGVSGEKTPMRLAKPLRR